MYMLSNMHTHILIIFSFISGLCFWSLAVVSGAAVSMGVHIPLPDWDFTEYIP